MRKTNIEKYKKIYKTKVLPKKSVTKATPETFNETLELYKEYSTLRKRANVVVLGGKGNE